MLLAYLQITQVTPHCSHTRKERLTWDKYQQEIDQEMD